MLVISAGMPKAGTAWFYNLTDGVLATATGRTSAEARDAAGLTDVLRGQNCATPELDAGTLTRLLAASWDGASLVVKTHAAPTAALIPLLERGEVLSTYLYRDPRSAILSALECGVRMRARGQSDAMFSPMRTLVRALHTYIYNLSMVWEVWSNMPTTHVLRYEDLRTDPLKEVLRLASFMGVELSLEEAEGVVYRATGRRTGPRTSGARIQWGRGVPGRFRHVLNAEELRLCAEVLGPYLTEMGYPVDVTPDPAAPGLAVHLERYGRGLADFSGLDDDSRDAEPAIF